MVPAVGAISAAWGVAAAAAGAQDAAPLSPFAAQTISVLPVQFLHADSTSPVQPARWATVRKELDDSIGVTLAERGLGKKWAYAADLERMARRNAGYVSDPSTLGAGGLRNRALKIGEPAPPIVISNLRSLIALGDSRYALVPVELGFGGAGADARVVLRLVVLDGRVGQVVWYTDLAAPGNGKFGSAEIGDLAQRVADLVIAR